MITSCQRAVLHSRWPWRIERRSILNLRKTFYILLGCVFLAIGLAGWILPLMHGTLFSVIGLLILTTHSTRVRNWVNRFMNRHPKIKSQYEAWREKAAEYGRRWSLYRR